MIARQPPRVLIVRSPRRARRPLLALVALVLALVVGYAVRAADSGTGPSHPTPTTTSTPG